MAETYTGKSINESLDELIEDFRYSVGFLLDLFERYPSILYEEPKKVENVKEFQIKYFEGE